MMLRTWDEVRLYIRFNEIHDEQSFSWINKKICYITDPDRTMSACYRSYLIVDLKRDDMRTQSEVSEMMTALQQIKGVSLVQNRTITHELFSREPLLDFPGMKKFVTTHL